MTAGIQISFRFLRIPKMNMAIESKIINPKAIISSK
jgi:hypothetical protein